MNNSKRYKIRNRILIFMAVATLIVLLFLLAHVEQEASNSTIKTPLDALWYFLATVTTVGYGDVSPVTPFGKVMGIFFILLSCGFISILITSIIHFMNSSAILRTRIFLARVERWYIFDRYCPESVCLARQLSATPEDNGFIFCGAEHQIRDLFKFRCIFTSLSVDDVLSICTSGKKNNSIPKPAVFLIGENEESNLKTALAISSADSDFESGRTVSASEAFSNGAASINDPDKVQIYCRTCVRFQTPPKGLHTFDPSELTARAYWAENPLTSSEKNVILIGEGALINFLIEQAVLVNVFGPLLRCRYHIFSKNEEITRNSHTDESFMEDHPHITDVIDVVSVNTMVPAAEDPLLIKNGVKSVSVETLQEESVEAPANDTLCFHEEHWDSNHACLETADRIIICSSSEMDNIRIAEKIRLLCPTRARLFIFGNDSIDGVSGFGSLRQLYTPERIMREELLRRAVALNEYYNSLQDDKCKKTCWDDLSMFSRRSNMAAADHMNTKLRILTGNLDRKTAVPTTPDTTALAIKNFRENVVDRELCRRIEHERWMRFHCMYGWRYGEVRDNERRRHPLLVPFEQLTAKEQELDDISWELISTLLD